MRRFGPRRSFAKLKSATTTLQQRTRRHLQQQQQKEQQAQLQRKRRQQQQRQQKAVLKAKPKLVDSGFYHRRLRDFLFNTHNQSNSALRSSPQQPNTNPDNNANQHEADTETNSNSNSNAPMSKYSNIIWEHRVLASTMRLQRWCRQRWHQHKLDEAEQKLQAAREAERQIAEKEAALATLVQEAARKAVEEERQRVAQEQERVERERRRKVQQQAERERERMDMATKFQAVVRGALTRKNLRRTTQPKPPLKPKPKPKPKVKVDSLRKAVEAVEEKEDRDAEQLPERRFDSDGQAYTKEQFLRYYGGDEEWNQAETEKPSSSAANDNKAKKKSAVDLSNLPSLPGQIRMSKEVFRPGVLLSPSSSSPGNLYGNTNSIHQQPGRYRQQDEHKFNDPLVSNFATVVQQCNKLNRCYAQQGHIFRLLPVNEPTNNVFLHQPTTTMMDNPELLPQRLARATFQTPFAATRLRIPSNSAQDVSVYAYRWVPSRPLFLGDREDHGAWERKQQVTPAELQAEFQKLKNVAAKSSSSSSASASSSRRMVTPAIHQATKRRGRKKRRKKKKSQTYAPYTNATVRHSALTSQRRRQRARQQQQLDAAYDAQQGQLYRMLKNEAATAAAIVAAASSGVFDNDPNDDDYDYASVDNESSYGTGGGLHDDDVRSRLQHLSHHVERASNRRTRLRNLT